MTTGKGKNFSFVKAADESIAFYVKNVSKLDQAGAELTAADVQSVTASDLVRLRLNGAGDTDINSYTGATGAAGEVVYTDGNANTIQELIDVINDLAVGQLPWTSSSSRRWRAALGDVPPLYALTAADLLNQASPVNTLVGLNSVGVPVFMDISALASANEMYIGIGTEQGTKKGGGPVAPDYFEDIPGVSGTSGFASNTPDRSRRKAKQNDAAVVTSVNSVVIEVIQAFQVYANNDKVISVFTEDQDPATDTPIYEEVFGAATASAVLTGQPGAATIVGPPGKRLFVRSQGTGAFTNGSFVVTGHYEQSLRDAPRS